jgi:adenine-specific DNA-methyltransferase
MTESGSRPSPTGPPPTTNVRFPTTRYQGSKAKLVDWIWSQLEALGPEGLEFDTCLDAFGGTGAVAYRLKQEGKAVTYNDLLRFNHQFGLALIENRQVRLSQEDVDGLLAAHPEIAYPSFIRDTFAGVYFTDEENAWLDRTLTNVCRLDDRYKRALAFYALAQACIIKRPYNLFHRRNLYMRLARVDRSFGNKATWDTPFERWFRAFVEQANDAVFDNSRPNRALNGDAAEVPGQYDLVYIDTPYISQKGVGVDYRDFYHFLEGLTIYEQWARQIDRRSRHLRLVRQPNEWTDKRRVHAAFERLFHRFRESILVVSYRSDGIPSEDELVSMLRQVKGNVRVKYFGQYQYVLSTNAKSKEILLIGT